MRYTIQIICYLWSPNFCISWLWRQKSHRSQNLVQQAKFLLVTTHSRILFVLVVDKKPEIQALFLFLHFTIYLFNAVRARQPLVFILCKLRTDWNRMWMNLWWANLFNVLWDWIGLALTFTCAQNMQNRRKLDLDSDAWKPKLTNWNVNFWHLVMNHFALHRIGPYLSQIKISGCVNTDSELHVCQQVSQILRVCCQSWAHNLKCKWQVENQQVYPASWKPWSLKNDDQIEFPEASTTFICQLLLTIQIRITWQ